MADTPRPPDTVVGPDRGSKPGTPRWVKVFGIIGIVVLLLVGITLLTGGRGGGGGGGGDGGGHGPGRHAPSGDAAGPTPPAGGHDSTAGVGAPAGGDQAARMVQVTTLDTMAFQPSRINVSANETVRFVVTNTGQAVHEFTLGDAAMQQRHAADMAHDRVDRSNSITLRPGETKQLTRRFGAPGTLEYGCHEPGHYQAGMRGQITVT